MNFTSFKLLLLIFSFTLVVECFGQKNENLIFYNDTTFDLKDYTVSLKKTYLRKAAFLKTNITINNTSDRFILIDPAKVFCSGGSKNNEPSVYKKTVVIAPGYSHKFDLKFINVESGSPSISLNFSEIKMTKIIVTSAPQSTLAVRKGETLKQENIVAEILDLNRDDQGLLIKLRLRYKGANFMAVNYNNIALKNKAGEVCYNLKKPKGKFHINPNNKLEVVKLLLPNSCATRNESKKVLIFENVFTEYSLVTEKGFQITLRVSSNQQMLEEEKSEDIETID